MILAQLSNDIRALLEANDEASPENPADVLSARAHAATEAAKKLHTTGSHRAAYKLHRQAREAHVTNWKRNTHDDRSYAKVGIHDDYIKDHMDAIGVTTNKKAELSKFRYRRDK